MQLTFEREGIKTTLFFNPSSSELGIDLKLCEYI